MKFGQKLKVLTALVWTGLLTIAWLVIITRKTGWTKRLGLAYSIRMGLFEVQLRRGQWSKVAKAVMGRSLTERLLQKVHGRLRGISHLEHWNLWCTVGKNFCLTAKFVTFSTWGMLALSITGIILSVLAGALLFNWAYGKAYSKLRKYIRETYTLATCSFALGTSQYWLLMHRVMELPPMDTQGTPTGELTFAAAFLCVLSLVPIFCVGMLTPTEEEISNDLEVEFQQLRQELRGDGYGGTDWNLPPQVRTPTGLGRPDYPKLEDPYAGAPQADAFGLSAKR